MAVTQMCAVYAQAAPPLPAPSAMVVFTDKRTGLVVALSTDIEVEKGRVMPHFFTDYDSHAGISLKASPGPEIGKRWPLGA